MLEKELIVCNHPRMQRYEQFVRIALDNNWPDSVMKLIFDYSKMVKAIILNQKRFNSQNLVPGSTCAVVDDKNNIVYSSIKQAAKADKTNYSTFKNHINGHCHNSRLSHFKRYAAKT